MRRLLAALAVALPAAAHADCGFQDPAVSSWVINTTGAMGQSPDATIDAVVSVIPADVQRVRFTATDVYVEATGIPSYPVGPFPGDPNVPSDQQWVFRIPRTPQSADPGPYTATALGPIGVWVNGVVVFNAKDAMSYNNRDVWHQNAVVVEASSFDSALGHPAPDRRHPMPSGVYHHHQRPVSLLAQLGEDGVSHSPLVGFAFDGFPIYGPHAFANADGTGGVVRIRSSYRLRSITTRDTLPDGTVLPMASWGPAVSATYPLGYYIEDFEYVPGLGDLDEHDGRFAVTPEYPAGTYAYYTTEDAAGASAYPYAIGPTYYGVVLAENGRQSVVVPAGTCTFSATCREGDCPGSCADGIDDDLDGDTDCADSDCASDPACASSDSDGDGVNDTADCAPTDGTAFALPAESTGLRVTRDAAGDALLSWDDTAALSGTGTRYDVASDLVSVLLRDRAVSAPCIASGLATAAWSDATPVTDDALYYIVRAANACGPARGDGWGASSTGVPRSACP